MNQRQKLQWRGLRRLTRLIPAVALALLVAVAGGCRLDAVVDVDVQPDGSGMVRVTITTDDDAVELIPELRSGLRLDDISAAGWAIGGPVDVPGGGVVITAQKQFTASDQLQPILDEIAGPGVLFSDVRLVQTRTFGRTDWDFSAVVNPTPDLGAFSDAELGAVLDGNMFGRPLADIIAQTGTPEDSFGLEVALTMPDDIASPGDANTGDEQASQAEQAAQAAAGATVNLGEVAGATAEWQFSYGDAPETIGATAISERGEPGFWLNVSRAAAVAFVIALVVVAVFWVRGLIRTPKGRGRRAMRRATRTRHQRAAERAAEAHKPRQRLLRLVVVDAHGIIVRPTDPLEGLLLPVIRDEIADIDPELVRDRHAKLVLGRISPEEFWSDMGLGPIASGMETRFLSSYRLVPGLHQFLDKAEERSLPVAVVANQPRRWGERLRRMAQLEDSTALWLTSAEVGAALPHPPLLEATRRRMTVDAQDCLYLSSVPEYLDMAAKLQMNTAYFAASPADVLETSHTLVKGFDDILRSRTGP